MGQINSRQGQETPGGESDEHEEAREEGNLDSSKPAHSGTGKLPAVFQIYRCNQCPRFFYTTSERANHISSSLTCHVWNRRFSEPYPPIRKIHNHMDFQFGSLDRLDAFWLHARRPEMEMSKRELETERQLVCCTRCRIYFKSNEEKREHFRDADFLHDVEGLRNHSTQDDMFGIHGHFDFDYLSGHLSLLPPSARRISPTQRRLAPRTHSVFASPDPLAASQDVESHRSPDRPELRAGLCEVRHRPSPDARNATTVSRSSSEISSSSTAAEIPDGYECPLCLENQKNLSSLPCGHIFCTACICKTLESFTRCPMCRRPADKSLLRKFQSA